MTPTTPPVAAQRERVASPHSTWAATAALGVYYLATMSRDMSFYDSPELALVAAQGGVGHPIGQPLHTLLGHVLVGLGAVVGLSPLVCLNALSALACALTVVPVVYVLDHVASLDGAPPRDGAPLADPQQMARLRPWVVALVGVHASLWEPATRIEVYPLGTLLGALSVAALTAALRDARHGQHGLGRRNRLMALAGLLLALTTGANAVSATFFALAMAPAVLRALRARTLPVRALVPAVLAALVGMLVWIYVPLAARDPDVVAWGRPVDWPSLRAYLSGADYVGKSVGLLSAEFAGNLGAFAAWAARVGLLPLVALGFVGLAVRGRPLLPLAIILFFANVGWYARYDPFAPGVLDYLGYLGAPLWFLAGGCALLAGWAAERGRGALGAYVTTLLAVVLLAAPSPLERTRSQDHLTRDLSEAALAALPADAILLVEADHWSAPLLYLQEVEAQRPDVVVLPLGLASSSWLWELVYRRHPSLAPFAVRGPGGREGRVRRFLEANADRPAFTNDARLATRLGLPSCIRGVLSVLTQCTGEPAQDALAPLLARAHRLLGAGSPGTAGVLAWEGQTRAHALAAEGRARDAFHVLTLSVAGLDEGLIPARVPPFVLPTDELAALPRADAQGSPQRNLHLAAALALRAQQPALAQRLRQRALEAPR